MSKNLIPECIAFVLGMLFCGGGIILISDPIAKEQLVKEKTFNYRNVKYNVTIDSSATDSLFGKTWRK